ncbi:hypothetical protein QIN34_gp3 [ssRNA phage SRR7976324_1]|uniref:Uncharacterized protein n=1 Tax=ssRNA phage SRR7976324_1 TaxID=2786694 RepID=A0A8S5L0N2_9VIRU|nr:hypothetical protein QIN34_gp3 [ssRNA phage SRR7976324_1]DAD51168.1 TPA_asm: hypothetical protein [ssRNA phage SRR7976324_1]
MQLSWLNPTTLSIAVMLLIVSITGFQTTRSPELSLASAELESTTQTVVSEYVIHVQLKDGSYSDLRETTTTVTSTCEE